MATERRPILAPLFGSAATRLARGIKTQRLLQRTGLIVPMLWAVRLAARVGLTSGIAPANRKYLLGTPIPSREQWSERLAEAQRLSLGEPCVLLTESEVGASEAEPGQPLVAVLVTTFRSETYLPHFLRNLAAQTLLPKTEVIVVAVQPSELERQLLSDAAAALPMIRLIEVAEPMGIYPAWNLALTQSSAPFVTNMNVDDQRHPQSLEFQAQELLQTRADVVYQDVYLTLQHDLDWALVERVGERTRLPLVDASVLAGGTNAPHNAPMWRRALHERVGLFDERYRSAGDHDFWIRVALAGGRFHKSETAHVAYYVNPEGMSTNLNSPGLVEGLSLLARYRRLV